MRTILISFITFICMLAHTASAYDLVLNAPFSKAGSGQLTMRTLAKGLEAKGYNFDIIITSNPKLSKQNYADENKPMLLGWEAPASSKAAPLYMGPPTDKDLVAIVVTMGHFICTKKDISIQDVLSGKKELTIAHDVAFGNWVQEFADHTGAKLKLIPYKGSKKVENALVSGEVDLAMSTKGAGWQKKGLAKCLLTSGTDSVLGIQTVNGLYPDWNDNTLVLTFYIKSKNIPQDKLDQLRKDIEEVKKTSEEFAALVEKKTWTPVVDKSIDEQLSLLQAIDKTVK